ncbi:predicted protein [Lichtheimia corymbifera JMRC:FSU:9682]|uniref:Tc1-like transposase DDE domain-containing protein n=1 Tax=Lichtheimia corymbifera JMRC:FSU:9682 TaxID=1263082 RepID=A0A068SHB6_9FUNG|nr:predicted protein [Lichtheimia corymbifera JMRC:FSU:9682]
MKRGRKAKGDFNADVIRFIFDWVDEHEHTTVFDILDAMDTDALLEGSKPAKTTLHRWLRVNAHLTFKYSSRSFPPPPSQQENDESSKIFEEVFTSVDFHMYHNCIYIGEAAFITSSNRRYPLKPRPSHNNRIVYEDPFPDMCVLVALSGEGLIAHQIKSMQSVTTMDDIEDFLKIVFQKLQPDEGESLFYAFDSTSTEVMDAITKVVTAHGDDRKAVFLPLATPSKNPADVLVHDILYKADRRPLDSNRNEDIDKRVNSTFADITPELCYEYIKASLHYEL